jgi:transposase-like protein
LTLLLENRIFHPSQYVITILMVNRLSSYSKFIKPLHNAEIEQVVESQNRPLDTIYPIVYLDCIMLKIRQDKRVINKAIYLVLGMWTP